MSTSVFRRPDGTEYKLEVIHHRELGYTAVLWTPDDDVLIALSEETDMQVWSSSDLRAAELVLAKLRRYEDELEVVTHGGTHEQPDHEW